jgi:hypothetical protein
VKFVLPLPETPDAVSEAEELAPTHDVALYGNEPKAHEPPW